MTPEQERALAQDLTRWRESPAQMAWDLFQFTPDPWQEEGFRAFADPRPGKAQEISLKACVGPGKTAFLAICGWNFQLCYHDVGRQHPQGVATSISGDNLKDNLWKELALWRSRSPLLTDLFEQTSRRIFAKAAPETWFLSARSYAANANEEAKGRTLSGIHAPFVLALIDESGDIHPAVGRTARQMLSNCRWGKVVTAGNPTSHTGLLYDSAVNRRDNVTVIEITGDPDDPRRSPRISLEWAKSEIALHGRENPWVMASILGKFPPGGINQLISAEEVTAAMQRHYPEAEYHHHQKRLGVDPARFGDDRTVLMPRQGIAAFQPVTLRGKRGTEIADRVLLAKHRWNYEHVIIDSTGGWGQSAEDTLIARGEAPIAVNFSTPAIDPRYANRRAEMWWNMCEWTKRNGALPRVDGLVAEMSEPTYSYSGGKLLIEPKEMVKKRLKRSPDIADALALTFFMPDAPASLGHALGIPGLVEQQARSTGDYDPMEREYGGVTTLPAPSWDYDPMDRTS